MKRNLINWIGILGVISLLSYTVAVIFAPLAYPGYNWLSQAVSDLSANNAPSRTLWNQLSSLYGPCGIVSVTTVCIFIKDKLNKTSRWGIYLFCIMNWISNVGYTMFPLYDSGNAGAFQDIMHIYVITVLVVLLSIISLVLIMIGGYKNRKHLSLAIFASTTLFLMFVGAIGTNIAPKEIFGVFERFSVFAVTIFNAVLGIYLFNNFKWVTNYKESNI